MTSLNWDTLIANTIKDDKDCWIWQGPLNHTGYAQTTFGNPRRTVRIHREAYLLVYGEIPKDREVMHTCNTRACVNPNHLRLGTRLENMSSVTYPARAGARNTQAKMNSEAVKVIRYLSCKRVPIKKLARAYGISYSQANKIVNYESWPVKL